MTQHVLSITALLTLVSCAAAEPEARLPGVAYPYKYSGHVLTPREIQEIATFAQSVQGIDHHVQTISVKSSKDIEVETGRGRTVWGPEQRDMIRIQKRNGRWVVIQKEKLKVLAFD
jgi:hypothetical protein